MFTVIQKNDTGTRVLFKFKTESLRKARVVLTVLDDVYAYIQYSKTANREFARGVL